MMCIPNYCIRFAEAGCGHKGFFEKYFCQTVSSFTTIAVDAGHGRLSTIMVARISVMTISISELIAFRRFQSTNVVFQGLQSMRYELLISLSLMRLSLFFLLCVLLPLHELHVPYLSYRLLSSLTMLVPKAASSQSSESCDPP